jgi:predicted oxidoreductase
VWSAPTVEELAARAGIDAAGLARTLAEFEPIASGERPDPFGRAEIPAPIDTPPYYAVLSQAGTVVSFGGVRVDGDLRVTTPDGEPIPGLYAAGEVIGGAATMGDAYCGGMCVTPALSLGRWLGRTLASIGAATATRGG